MHFSKCQLLQALRYPFRKEIFKENKGDLAYRAQAPHYRISTLSMTETLYKQPGFGYNCGIHKGHIGNNICHNFHSSEHLVCNFTSTNSTLMKLKPMKFKQNGVRAESPKEKERDLGFCFSFFETQVHIKASARTHTCVIWLKCRFSCLMALDWLHQNNHRPQAEFSKPHPSNSGKRKELA